MRQAVPWRFRNRARRLAGHLRGGAVRSAALARLAVPGWPQIYAGKRTRSAGLVLAYAMGLLVALAARGALATGTGMGIAAGVHAASSFEALLGEGAEIAKLRYLAAMVAAAATLSLYYAAWRWLPAR